VKNKFVLDSLRQVRVTFNRFLSILIITILGVAFFAGLKATGPAMRDTAALFLTGQNFMDMRILSSVGFDDGDVAAIRKVESVKEVEPAYSADVIVNSGEDSIVIRLQSMPSAINIPKITEGRLPEASGECIVDPEFLELTDYAIGDQIQIASGSSTAIEDIVSKDTFTIVGTAHSPLYISDDRGTSSVGSGSTDAYIFIPYSDFTFEVNTEVYLTVDNPKGYSVFDDRYLDMLEPIKDSLERTGVMRSGVRFADITREAREELEDAKADVKDGYKELDDAEKELEDARRDLEEGKAEYAENKQEFEDEIADGQKKLDDGYAEYQNGLSQYESQLADFEAQSAAAETQFADAEAQLAAGQAEYDAGVAALEQGKALHTNLSQLIAAGNTPEAVAGISAIAGTIGGSQPELAAVLNAYAANPSDPAAAATASGAVQAFGETLSASESALAEAKSKLDSGYAEVAAGRAQLSDGRAQLDAAKAQLDAGKNELDANQAKLNDAKAEGQAALDEAAQEIADGEQELLEGEQEYNAERPGALADLKQAEADIAEAEAELADFEMPEWYLLDNETNAGFMAYKQDTARLDALSVVIPIFFFMVAVFVTMTSMTRLVESDRTYIGTVKSLGYSRGQISLRYLLYALSASLAGAVAGVAIGINFLPTLIFDTYGIMYTLPPLVLDFPWPLAMASVSIAVLCSALPAFFVCLKTVREVPSQLMRPESPEVGKRVFLERINFIWKRLSFTRKVSMRNLFRYKKRLVMTLVGVAGCTALMFTGFALQDAISTIIPRQYDQIMKYDMQVGFSSDDAEGDDGSALLLGDMENIESGINIFNQSVDATKGTMLYSTTLIVPDDPENFQNYIHLRDRGTGKTIPLGDDSVVVAEKLVKLLGLEVGDSFKLRDSDGNEYNVTLGAVMENYLSHYVYMSPALYEKLSGKAFTPNQGLYHLSDTGADTEKELSERLMDMDGISSVSFTSAARGSMQTTIDALQIIVLVLVISAAALVFVVLFSLISINIEERGRELATIKVLGFTDRELSSYIYRESNILTVLGIILGIFGGIFLQRFILTTMESNFMMFSYDLLWQSFVYSSGLTIAFALFVNLLMFPHIRKIDMISSLKSVE